MWSLLQRYLATILSPRRKYILQDQIFTAEFDSVPCVIIKPRCCDGKRINSWSESVEGGSEHIFYTVCVVLLLPLQLLPKTFSPCTPLFFFLTFLPRYSQILISRFPVVSEKLWAESIKKQKNNDSHLSRGRIHQIWQYSASEKKKCIQKNLFSPQGIVS